MASGLLFFVQSAPGFQTPIYVYQKKGLGFSEQFIALIALVQAVGGALGGMFYGCFCRRWSLRTLLYPAIGLRAASSLLYLGYEGKKSALALEGACYFLYYLAQLPLSDLAARATPKGPEALGYSIIISAWNWGLFPSDIVGSALFDRAAPATGWALAFKHLVWINAVTTAIVLIAVPFLPRKLVDVREGESSEPAPQPA